jgi:hypothetical protein
VPFWALVPHVRIRGLGAQAAGEVERGLVLRRVGVGLLLIWTRSTKRFTTFFTGFPWASRHHNNPPTVPPIHKYNFHIKIRVMWTSETNQSRDTSF